jgi:hypothetical protein
LQLRAQFIISKYENGAFLLRKNQDVHKEEEGERVLYLTEDEHYSVSANRLRG